LHEAVRQNEREQVKVRQMGEMEKTGGSRLRGKVTAEGYKRKRVMCNGGIERGELRTVGMGA